MYPLIAHATDTRYHSTSSQDPRYGSSESSDFHIHSTSSIFIVHGHQKRDGGNCTGFKGDSDTYGLGIRIGLYFQWVTSSIAYNLVPSEAINMRGVNNCFQLAMFAGLLYVTITNEQLHAVEAYLILLFCMGGVCSGTVEVDDEIGEDRESRVDGVARKSYAYLEASSLGGYVRVLLGCGFIGYGLWFVFLGMDNMHHKQTDCNYVFFLARVDLFGWFRTLLKILFVCATIPAVLSLVFMTISLVNTSWVFFLEGGWQGRVRPHKHGALPSNGENVTSSKSKQSTSSEVKTALSEDEAAEASEDEKPGLQNIKLRKQNVGFSGALLFFILSVELIIKWNKIEQVGSIGSTGQLLPVIIGVGGAGRVVIRLIRDLLEETALIRRNRILARRSSTGFNNDRVRVEDHPRLSQPMGTGGMTNNLPGTSTQQTGGTGNTLDNLAPSTSPAFVHDIESLAFTPR